MPDNPTGPVIPDDLTSLTRAQLAELETQLIDRAAEIRDQTDPDAVAELTRIAATLPSIGERIDQADQAQRDTDTARSTLDSYQRRAVQDQAQVVDVEADTVTDVVTDAAPADGGGGEVVPVAASGRSASEIARRAPQGRIPAGGASNTGMYAMFTAGADMPGITASARFSSAKQFNLAVIERTENLVRSDALKASAKIARGHLDGIDIDSGNHILPSDGASEATGKMLEASRSWLTRDRQSLTQLTAATGWCAPTETIWDLCDPYVADGMVTLPEIGITRGGIRYFPMPDLACFNQYSWEFGPDELECMEKPCLEIPCPEPVEVEPGVIGACLTAGILQTRAFPELVDRYVRGLMTAHLMLISKRTLEMMEAGSDPVVYDDALLGGNGFTAALLNSMEFQAEDLREDYLLAESDSLAVQIPRWVRGAIRADLANRPGYDGLDITDAYIDRLFSERGLTVYWIKGWQNEAVGAPGAQRAYPTTVKYLIYREGAWVRGLEPIIELESQYDSVLLRQNKYTRLFTEQAFMVANLCTRSRVVTVPVCPNGSTAQPQPIVCFSETPTPGTVTCPPDVDCSPVVSIDVTPNPVNAVVGGTQQLTVTATREQGGTSVITRQATYQSSNPAVATVSSAGVVTAVAAGNATITASYTPTGATTPLTDTTDVVVTAAPPTSIAVTPATANVAVGATQQLAVATNLGVDVTATATYTSSDPAVATVDAAGLVTGVAAGTATITASYTPVGGGAALTSTAAITVA